MMISCRGMASQRIEHFFFFFLFQADQGLEAFFYVGVWILFYLYFCMRFVMCSQDELVWGAAWIYKASGNSRYWKYVTENIGRLDGQEFGWDNKEGGIRVLIYKVYIYACYIKFPLVILQ